MRFPLEIVPGFKRGMTGLWTPVDRRTGAANDSGPRNHGAFFIDDAGARFASTNVTIKGSGEGLVWDFPATGGNDWINIEDSAAQVWNHGDVSPLYGNTQNYTFACRCMHRTVDGNARGVIMSRAADFNSNGYWLYKEGTSTGWRWAQSKWDGRIDVASAGLNEWATVVATLDSSNNGTLTVNGVTASATPFANAADDEVQDIALGNGKGSSAQRVMDGQIRYFAAWNRILSQGEIAWLMDNPQGPILL